jgi:ubiquinone/menaquinone biosynthesis C-methylase UbiE
MRKRNGMPEVKGEKPAYDFTSHSAEYEEELGKSHKYFIQAKCEELLRSLKTHGLAPNNILDLGCGTGEVEEIIAGKFEKIIGIDSSAGMIGRAKEKKLKNCLFQQGDALKLPFADGVFDCAFSFCLFHHIPPGNWGEAMKEAARVIKKSGVIFTFEHNPGNPVTRHVVKNSPVDAGVTLLDARKIEELYRSAGIRVIEKKYILFFPAFVSFLRPLERALGAVPYGGQYYVAGVAE